MPHEILTRITLREFLLEPNLYKEVGLEQLPAKLAQLLDVPAPQAIDELTRSPLLDALDVETLEHLLAIRDMGLISRTAAAVAAELKGDDVTYDHCCRRALVYAVAGMTSHVYTALRAASAKDDSYARHHYLYALILAVEGDLDRALWELEMALEREPYADARLRIRVVAELLEQVRPANS